MRRRSQNSSVMKANRWALIPCAVTVVLWHGILVAAALSGKGFLGNLAFVWCVLFFMLPPFNLLVCLVAFGEGVAKRKLNWSHAVLALLALLPVASFLCYEV